MARARSTARTLFLSYVAAASLALLMALPLASSFGQGEAQRAQLHSFENVDRNKDGQVDKSEAGAVPGLSANFEKVDRNRDGRLDRGEFTRALAMLGAK
jgi:Ca2+-binding EF-hand superfamily protein